jgi:hypothetical protein
LCNISSGPPHGPREQGCKQFIVALLLLLLLIMMILLLCLTVAVSAVRARAAAAAAAANQVIEFFANGPAVEEFRPRTPQELGLHPRDVTLFAPLSRLAAPQVGGQEQPRHPPAVLQCVTMCYNVGKGDWSCQ